MRPGLVAVGAVIALVGAGVIVAIIDPGDNPTVSRASEAYGQGLTTGSWRTFLLHTTVTSHASFSLTWYASASTSVRLYAMYACSSSGGFCPLYPAIATWPGGVNASWSASGAAGAAYELWAEPAGISSTLNFSATFTETYRVGTLSLPLMAFAMAMAGGSVLVGIGGVVLYLGLFLPAGVYQSIDPPPPEELSPAPPVRSGSSAGPTMPGRSR